MDNILSFLVTVCISIIWIFWIVQLLFNSGLSDWPFADIVLIHGFVYFAFAYYGFVYYWFVYYGFVYFAFAYYGFVYYLFVYYGFV